MRQDPEQPIVCTKCEKTFPVNLLTSQLPKGWERWFMKCPHCGEEWEIARVSPEGKDISRSINALRVEQRRRYAEDREKVIEQLEREFRAACIFPS